MTEPRGYHNAVSDPEKAAIVEQFRRIEAEGGSVVPLFDESPLMPLSVTSPQGANPTGRPPSPWKISGLDVLDRLDDGAMVYDVAVAAGVSQRTLMRVLRKCGFVRGRMPREQEYAPWLPMRLMHRIDELAHLRTELRRRGWSGGPVTFAGVAGLEVSMVRDDRTDNRERIPAVWRVMDEVDLDEQRGWDWSGSRPALPGEPGSPWPLMPDRAANKSSRSKLPRRSVGGRPRNSQLDDSRIAIVYAYAQGESLDTLARRFGVSISTMHRRLREWGQGEEMARRRAVGRRRSGGPGGAQTGSELRFPDESPSRG